MPDPVSERSTWYAHHDMRAPHVAAISRATLAVVLAGGRGTRLGPLTQHRSKPAVPFGGKFRIIDFSLSNCINSGLRRVAIVTQYKAQSLLRHTQEGWNFLDGRVHEFIETIPAQQRVGHAWYQGTAEALYQNIDPFRAHRPRHVLVIAGDHIYRMDYGVMLLDHIEQRAEATVACIPVPVTHAHHFGVMTVRSDGCVTSFEEKPQMPMQMPSQPGYSLASMGIYVFDAEFLFAELRRDSADGASSHDFGRDLIPALVGRGCVAAHDFTQSSVVDNDNRPYWRDVGTIDAYWEASIDLTHVTPELNLYDAAWPILTAEQPLPPAKFVFADRDRRGLALDSLVSSGCIVSGGRVERSLLSTNVRVGSYSRIEDSVILPDTVVGSRVTLRKAVVDRSCILPDGFVVGVDPEVDRRRFFVTDTGVSVITPDMLRA
jgi:glucose-1-phosphate adenylyltransferase